MNHPNLIKAVIAEIDRLGAMTCDELLKQNDIGLLELLDMAITLKTAYQEKANDSDHP